MKSQKIIYSPIFITILICGLLVGCGPSAETLAVTSVALTAAAATRTPTTTPIPTDTPTPTPIPFDLSVSVVDEDDMPIIGAMIVMEGIEGENKTRTSDGAGQAVFNNLAGETINFRTSAQGYLSIESTETILRGSNVAVVHLERDPHGILPSEACMPGEQLLYIEDFQDGEAQGWMEIEYGAQEWAIVPNPDNPGDLIVTRPATYEGYANLQDKSFDNAVWRFKLMHTGKSVSNFAWHWHDEPYETEAGRVQWSAYTIWNHFPDMHIYRVQEPTLHLQLRITPFVLRAGVWHQIEISTFEGRYEVWVDGVPWVQFDDPEPLPEGRIVIGVGMQHTPDVTEKVYFNDMSVCELASPVTPLPTPGS